MSHPWDLLKGMHIVISKPEANNMILLYDTIIEFMILTWLEGVQSVPASLSKVVAVFALKQYSSKNLSTCSSQFPFSLQSTRDKKNLVYHALSVN